MPNRIEILRRGVSRAHRIIEVGPSYSPLFPKRDGWQSCSIDHTDQAGLIAKYRDDPTVETAPIEAVDFVWHGGDLADAVPPELHGSFDVFVASHVIEHTTDLVAFLRSAERLLKPGGEVILAIPDKRLCFDVFRPVSTLGQVLEAHGRAAPVHSEATLTDFHAYSVTKGGVASWHRGDQSAFAILFPFQDVRDVGAKLAAGAYVDCHNWIFVPSSFALIVLGLARLGLTDWRIAWDEQAANMEFYARLQRGGATAAATMTADAFAAETLRLMMAAAEEQAEQFAPTAADLAMTHRLAVAEAALAEARALVATIRASSTWRLRSRLRRLLGLPAISTDRAV